MTMQQRAPCGEDRDNEPTLADRAAKAARAELHGDRGGILGAIGTAALAPLKRRRSVPERWTLLHVMDRMEEAFRVLSRLPLPTRPKGFVNAMPVYLYDRGDLNSQLETRELERLARMRNHVRIPPSPAELSRSEESLRWPWQFLAGREFHHVARAVNLDALWAASDTDVEEALKRIGLPRRMFHARKLQGLRIITTELVRRRVPVR
jgi:hypothetical protein